MRYTVRMDSRTSKTLDRLPGDMHGRVVRKLEALEENPRPFGVEKLTGPEVLYRVRAGDWRIVYSIRDRELVVIVIRRHSISSTVITTARTGPPPRMDNAENGVRCSVWPLGQSLQTDRCKCYLGKLASNSSGPSTFSDA